MLSIWEKKNFVRYDYIVIGAGITGLSTACSLKEKNPKARILILEHALIPSGASSRNAGFLSIGTLSEMQSEIDKFGENKFIQNVEDRLKGSTIIRNRLGDDNIGYEKNGSYELILKGKLIKENGIEKINDALKKIFNENVFHTFQQLIPTFGLNQEMISDIVVNPLDGQVDTGKLMQTLWGYAGIMQIRIITGAEIFSIHEGNNYVVVETGSNEFNIQKFYAEKVAVCTNAFTSKIFPQIDLTPIKIQLSSTTQIPDLKIKGIYSFNDGQFYFRNFDNRILIGSMCDMNNDEDISGELNLNESLQQQIEFFLDELILPGKKYSIEQKWTGVTNIHESNTDSFEKVSERIIVALNQSGTGISLCSMIAENISTFMLSES